MRGQRFRLNTPTLAILTLDGHNLPVTVPTGSIVQVKNGPLDGDRLIDVVWDGEAPGGRHRGGRQGGFPVICPPHHQPSLPAVPPPGPSNPVIQEPPAPRPERLLNRSVSEQCVPVACARCSPDPRNRRVSKASSSQATPG